MLASLVGRAMGHRLHALSRNVDARRVQTGIRRRSVGAQRALGRARHSPAELDVILVTLMDRITRRMRGAGRTGRTVVLRMRFDDFSRATRSHTLSRATASTEPLVAAARQLLSAASPLIGERGLTLMGFSVANIDRCGVEQLELPFGARPDPVAIDTAIDRVRQRYGTAAVTRAVLLHRDCGLEMPHLPD